MSSQHPIYKKGNWVYKETYYNIPLHPWVTIIYRLDPDSSRPFQNTSIVGGTVATVLQDRVQQPLKILPGRRQLGQLDIFEVHDGYVTKTITSIVGISP